MLPVALSSEDGEVLFELAEENSGDSRVRKTTEIGKMNEENREAVGVRAARFDTFLSETKVEPNEIDLLWIDIQGHDGHFLKGARDFFRPHKVPVISEFWGYGIDRSGMSRREYCEIITSTFTQFYHFVEGVFHLRPISEIDQLFEKYISPREIGSIILI